MLSRIVEYYNFIHENTERCEYAIISDQMKTIDKDLTILLKNYTWIDFGMYRLLQFSQNGKIKYMNHFSSIELRWQR